MSDNAEDISFLEQAFLAQPGNYKIKNFNSGLELLEFLSNEPVIYFPLLIIADQFLSKLDSLTLLKKLKENKRLMCIPVAIMSEFISKEITREYYLHGANCFFKKPSESYDWNHMAGCMVTLFSHA